MPIEVISAGFPVTILQNVVYALPASRVYIVSNVALQFSLQQTTGFTADVTATVTGVESAYPFVRCATGPAIVSVKKM